jgi:hypothetical protein
VRKYLFTVYNTATSWQRDYLLALRNIKKVLRPACEKTSAIFLDKISIYTIEQWMETTYLANRFWLQAKKLVFKFIFDICILEMCPTRINENWVCIAYRTIIKFIINTENTIQLFQLQQYLLTNVTLNRFRPGYLEVRIFGSIYAM